MKIKFEKEVQVNCRPGEIADFPKEKAMSLINKGFAKALTVQTKPTDPDKKKSK